MGDEETKLGAIRERLLAAQLPAAPLLYRGKSDTVHLPSTDPGIAYGLQLARFRYDEWAPENVPTTAVWNLWANAHVDIATLLDEVERLRGKTEVSDE